MMKTRFLITAIGVALLAFVLVTGVEGGQSQAPQLPDGPQGSAFTYQGRLTAGGSNIEGTCNFDFSLWDSESGGSQIGTALPMNDVPISQGLFTVNLNFGSSAFDGQERWLQTKVQCPEDAEFTTLGRQAITASPYASYSLEAGHALDADFALDSDRLDGHDASDFGLPANVLYVFSSNSTTKGNPGGRSGMNSICQSADQLSHFCNLPEIENAFLTSGVYFASPFSESWVDHAMLPPGGGEFSWQSQYSNYGTCVSWTDNTVEMYGTTILASGKDWIGKTCDKTYSVACCKWIP